MLDSIGWVFKELVIREILRNRVGGRRGVGRMGMYVGIGVSFDYKNEMVFVGWLGYGRVEVWILYCGRRLRILIDEEIEALGRRVNDLFEVVWYYIYI